MTDDTATTMESIALLGLGIMGRAIARCYSYSGYRVHAWNRGKHNRELTQALNLPNVVIHDDPNDAVHQSDLVLMVVMADQMLATAEAVIRSVDAANWKGKTLVQFTSHEPFAIKAQEDLIRTTLKANLIGGAMMAVPSTVGTEKGIFLVSSRDPALVEQHLVALQALGSVVPLTGDTGLASLADIGLLQALQFGLAGNELSCLIFGRYGVDQAFRDTYMELLPKTTLPILDGLSQLACKAVFSNDYKEQSKVYTAAGHLSAYLEQFRKVNGTEGPAAIVNTYSFASPKNAAKKHQLNTHVVCP